jgi:hypothetical protein
MTPSESDDEHISDNASVKTSGSDITDTKLRHKRRPLQVVISDIDFCQSKDVTNVETSITDNLATGDRDNGTTVDIPPNLVI